ncbi:MAG: hypothetical protein IT287_03525 [Bdellovibrionaceae bacterium]|nr:hypothetical protein [Pseudobdellovibrionaceae bacterium]
MRTSPLITKSLLLLVAGIGLSNCSDKSKNGNSDIPPGPSPAGDVKPLYTHEDPTVHGINQFRIAEDDLQKSVAGNAPKFTGMQTSDGLRFTDSQEDNLIEKARSVLSQVNPQHFQANLDFAQRLSISQVVVNPENPSDVRVSFMYQPSKGGPKYLTSSGVLQNMFGSRSALLQNINTSSAISVFVRCMDEDGTCYNVLLKFQDPSNTLAYGIFRTSPLRIRFYAENMFTFNNQQNPGVFKPGQNGPIITPQDNEDFDFDGVSDDGYKCMLRFYRTLVNSIDNNHVGGKKRRHITNVVLETASIVNGVSRFSLFVKIQNRTGEESLLPLFGDLVRRGGNKNNTVDMPLSLFKSIVLKDYSSDDIDDSLNSMSGVSLLQNNGKGSFQLGLSFGADQHQSDRLVLTISRTPVRILDIPNYAL